MARQLSFESVEVEDAIGAASVSLSQGTTSIQIPRTFLRIMDGNVLERELSSRVSRSV